MRVDRELAASSFDHLFPSISNVICSFTDWPTWLFFERTRLTFRRQFSSCHSNRVTSVLLDVGNLIDVLDCFFFLASLRGLAIPLYTTQNNAVSSIFLSFLVPEWYFTSCLFHTCSEQNFMSTKINCTCLIWGLKRQLMLVFFFLSDFLSKISPLPPTTPSTLFLYFFFFLLFYFIILSRDMLFVWLFLRS